MSGVRAVTELSVRKATEHDLGPVGSIWYEAATEGEVNPPSSRGAPSLYQHEVATLKLIVLERDREMSHMGQVSIAKPSRFWRTCLRVSTPVGRLGPAVEGADWATRPSARARRFRRASATRCATSTRPISNSPSTCDAAC
jgi:hypothetical protein